MTAAAKAPGGSSKPAWRHPIRVRVDEPIRVRTGAMGSMAIRRVAAAAGVD